MSYLPNPDGQPDPRLLKPVIMTLLLMASSVTVYTAELGSRRGDLRRLHAGLAATFVLGLSFLILQGFEYHEKLVELRPSTNAYGSLFYTITGLHGSHVIVGLLMIRSRPAENAAGNVLSFELEAPAGGIGCRLVLRPSGTEPKLKLYALAHSVGGIDGGALARRRAEVDALVDRVLHDAQTAVRSLMSSTP